MTSVAILGAGVSGLAAAHTLRAGRTVTLFEQSRDIGGRATTRAHDGFIYDYGAQYIKGGSSLSTEWITKRFPAPDLIDISKPVWTFDSAGHIKEGDPKQNAEAKWSYRNGLSTLAKRMAEGLDIRFEVRIARIQQIGTGWDLYDMAGLHMGSFDQLLITIPAPQAVELIHTSVLNHSFREAISEHLSKAHYNPLLSVMLGYKPMPRRRPYYALVNTDKAHPISWLAWEHEKAAERAPEGTGLFIAQMAPQYSKDHRETSSDILYSNITQLISLLIDEQLSAPIFADMHYWLYALPAEKADAGALDALTLPQGLAFCGDAFVGGRVHLALEHGVHVAQQLMGAR